MKQRSLFDRTPTAKAMPQFSGATYEPKKDHARLGKQMLAVFDAMRGGDWWTLAALEEVTEYPQSSISARLRDLRKERFGGHLVHRRRRGDGGTFEYRLEETL